MAIRRGRRPAAGADGRGSAATAVKVGEGGSSPEPHPLLARLDSPLSTYYLLIGVTGALLLIGLVMVLSASSVVSYQETGDSFQIGMNQAKFAVLGIAGAIVASRLPVDIWRRLAVPTLVLATFLQLLVFVPGLGVRVNGNLNWLRLGGLQLQPSEFGKLALVLYGATILTQKRHLLVDWRHAVIPYVVPVALVVIGLVLKGGDLGTTFVLLGVVGAVLWTSGIRARVLGAAAGAGAALVLAMAAISSNRRERISGWLSCGGDNTDDIGRIRDVCWQTAHGEFALADGGLGGRGLGASLEKWGWLPERHNDFIFAVIGEELGIGGTLTILLLVCLLAFACYRVIWQSDDMFQRLATAGVMGWIVVQSVVNIGAVIGLLPVIGVPLPLVSAGGSALVTTLFALGMVISFARTEPACQRALSARPGRVGRSLAAIGAARKGRR
ncbi:MAG: putative lipid II flippase FtsW [Dermatophilaceae bacterium]